MNDNDPSILRNAHEDLPAPTPPTPIKGEVKALANDPAQEDTVSVLANKAETVEPARGTPTDHFVGDTVVEGASVPHEIPPSVLGTSYAPAPKDEPVAMREEHEAPHPTRSSSSTHRRR